MFRPVILQSPDISYRPEKDRDDCQKKDTKLKGRKEYLIRAIATIINPTDLNFGLFALFAGSG